MPDLRLPLAGLVVVDLTVERGELCARLLADLGARVIKVEPPGGSPARFLPPVRDGVSLAWSLRNAGKESVVLDLGAQADRRRLEELLAHSDVVCYSPGLPSAPGASVDGPGLAAAHPHLVVAALSGFGAGSPYAGWATTDGVLSATGGLAFQAGVAEEPPLLTPGLMADDIASSTAAFAVLCALFQREHTGAGQYVEVSFNDAMAQTANWTLPNASVRIRAGLPAGEVRSGSGPVYPIFRCKGGFVRLVVLSPRQWRSMREWLGEPDFLQDPEYDGFAARLGVAEAVLNPLYEAHFASMSSEEVSAEAQRRGIVCTPVLTPAEVLANDHLRSRRTFRELEVAPGRRAPLPSGYFEVDGRRAGPSVPPPAPGEHTDAVFASLGEARTGPAAAAVPAPPLAGLRVMDFGHGAVGVETGRLFAEYGADVIKIETRTYPDFIRVLTGTEMSPSFASSSRSKRSLGINGKTDAGRALLHRLAAISDLVIENTSTGTMDDLGVGFEDLRAVNPGIVMVSSQLMGSHGEWADWRGYGPSTQPPGGLVHLWNYAGWEQPAGSASIFPDHFAGRLCAVAALAGLLGRARGTTSAVHAEVAQIEAVTGALGDLLAAEGMAPGSVRPLGSRSERGAPWGLYPCAGTQRWVAITCRDDADWQALIEVMGSPDWAADDAFATAAGRAADQDRLDALIGEWTSGRERDEVAAACQAGGVPAGPMLTCVDMMEHPHYRARGFAVEIDQPGVGPIALEGAAFVGSCMVGPDIRPAPALGEHTREVCRSLLDLDDAEIDRLLAEGALEGPRAG